MTIEEDIADPTSAKIADTDSSEKIPVNDLLPKDFQVTDDPLSRRQPFELKTFKTGLRPDIAPARLEELLDEI